MSFYPQILGIVDRLNELWLKECDKLIKELFYNNK